MKCGSRRKERKQGKRIKKSTLEYLKRSGRAFTKEDRKKIYKIMEVLNHCYPGLRKWLSMNLSILTVAMMTLWSGARSGNGWLSLSALSRVMPLLVPEKMRSKRLYRLLSNKWLEGSVLTPMLVYLVLGEKPPQWIPIVVDQTTIRGVEVIMAGIHLCGRTIPVAFTCFTHETLYKSQNFIESALLKLIAASLPERCKPVYIMDRGYARVELINELKQLGIPFIIRGRKNVIVRVGKNTISLGRLSYRMGKPIRYNQILYHCTKQELIDVVVFHDPKFKEPWYLLLPPCSEKLLPTNEVISLYRERMWIELTFRDWKTHLGVRGLKLKVEPHIRMERLLLALTAAYIIVVALGACQYAIKVRLNCEILRTKPRHGTRRTLSVLSVGILMLSLPQFAQILLTALIGLLNNIIKGKGVYNLGEHNGISFPDK